MDIEGFQSDEGRADDPFRRMESAESGPPGKPLADVHFSRQSYNNTQTGEMSGLVSISRYSKQFIVLKAPCYYWRENESDTLVNFTEGAAMKSSHSLAICSWHVKNII